VSRQEGGLTGLDGQNATRASEEMGGHDRRQTYRSNQRVLLEAIGPGSRC